MNKLLLPALVALMSSATFAQMAETMPDSKQEVSDTTEMETAADAAAPEAKAECRVEIEGNDAMKYNIDNFAIDKEACEEFTVTLHHVGSLPKNAMGHNVVISHIDDYTAVAQDGLAAGLENNYVKADDERVIAHTDVIGGGETTEITFKTDMLTPGENYEFFCSFPGHYAMMKGTIDVK